jgi:hypothetical protein
VPTWAAILIAVVAPGGVIVTLLERTRRENNRDHAKNAAKLDRVIEVAEETRDRLNDHIDWHLRP